MTFYMLICEILSYEATQLLALVPNYLIISNVSLSLWSGVLAMCWS